MLIFVLDDEPAALRASKKAVREAVPGAEVLSFTLPAAALEEARAQEMRPDIAFIDIEMPGMTGLEFAVRLKTFSPDTRIIFATAYSQYAGEAMKMNAHGYIMKPLEADDVREELGGFPEVPASDEGKLRVRCFGRFDVFWHGAPLIFARTLTLELFAYLVYRECELCTREDIIWTLWKEDDDLKAARNRLRVLLYDMSSGLRRVGMENALIREKQRIGLRRECLDCDYYRMLEGDPAAVNAYRGTFMEPYRWAVLPTGRIIGMRG